MASVRTRTCGQCPFRRTSVPGYLGAASGNPVAFLNSFGNGEFHLPCHCSVNWDADDAQAKAAEAPVCRGAAIYLANQCKLPRNPEMSTAVSAVAADRSGFLCSTTEFVAHHSPGTECFVVGNFVVSAQEFQAMTAPQETSEHRTCNWCGWAKCGYNNEDDPGDGGLCGKCLDEGA